MHPQDAHNGNPDVTWNHGVVFTAKADGLWSPTKKITEEDVTHLRNRCDEFYFNHVFGKGTLREVTPCAHHMAAWIVKRAGDYDACVQLANGEIGASPTLPLSLPLQGQAQDDEAVQGFKRLMETLHIPSAMQEALLADLEELGAASVAELTAEDWEGLPSWNQLKPLQKRRVLQQAVGPRSG